MCTTSSNTTGVCGPGNVSFDPEALNMCVILSSMVSSYQKLYPTAYVMGWIL